MANRPTLQPTARVGDDPTIRRLRELAAQEAAATKERLATRTAAARLFSGAVARLAETEGRLGARPNRSSARPGRGGRGPPRLRHAAWTGDRTARHLEEGACRACVLRDPRARQGRGRMNGSVAVAA